MLKNTNFLKVSNIDNIAVIFFLVILVDLDEVSFHKYYVATLLYFLL